jgi:hypothetical protein
VQGAQAEAGLGDDVYIAWERYPFATGAGGEIHIRRSTNLGGAFASAVTVTPVTPIGDSFVLQGQYRTSLDLQGLTVDFRQASFSSACASSPVLTRRRVCGVSLRGVSRHDAGLAGWCCARFARSPS